MVRVQVLDTIILVEKFEVFQKLYIRGPTNRGVLELCKVIFIYHPIQRCFSLFRYNIVQFYKDRSRQESAKDRALNEFAFASDLVCEEFDVTAPNLVED